MKIRTLIFSFLMLAAAALSFWYVPKPMKFDHPLDLATLVPEHFGNWHAVPNVQLVTAQEPDSLEKELYSQVLGRAYTDDDNHVVMLLLAYGPSQSDRLQLHRPEICYVANGFHVGNMTRASIDIPDLGAVPTRELVATRADRLEYITYWMRIGNQIASSVYDRQLIKLEYGLKRIVPDGLLVRLSVVGSSAPDAYRLQSRFIQALIMSSPAQLQAQLTGHVVTRLARD